MPLTEIYEPRRRSRLELTHVYLSIDACRILRNDHELTTPRFHLAKVRGPTTRTSRRTIYNAAFVVVLLLSALSVRAPVGPESSENPTATIRVRGKSRRNTFLVLQ